MLLFASTICLHHPFSINVIMFYQKVMEYTEIIYHADTMLCTTLTPCRYNDTDTIQHMTLPPGNDTGTADHHMHIIIGRPLNVCMSSMCILAAYEILFNS